MKVKDLIKKLQAIKNQEAEITLLGNVGYSEDEETDLYFDNLELWEDGEQSITLFVGLSNERVDAIINQQKNLQ
jgi:hypothetical protein